MADDTRNPEDAVSRAAQRFAERRDRQRAVAREAQVRQDSSAEATSAGGRKLVFGLLVVVFLVAAGWFLLMQMRCAQRYSNVSGFLFNDCR